MMLICFIFSFLMLFVSSYFLTSVCCVKPNQKDSFSGVLYFVLIVFAQIVLTFEILSIFNSIMPLGVLVVNFMVLVASYFVWQKFKKPLFVPDFIDTKDDILNVIKTDRWLMIATIGLLCFVAISLFMVVIMPVNSYDALAYHLARVPFWVANHNLNHFVYSDVRANVMPINSELLYTYIFVFFKSDIMLTIFSFISYIVSIFVIFAFLKELEIPTNKILWAVIIFSSFASIVLETSGTETDIMIGALSLVMMYLFLKGVKDDNKTEIYFASLAYVLAVGTKTPAIMAFPSILVYLGVMSYLYKGKRWTEPLTYFLKYFIFNFIFFASFYYVLNFIDFNHPLGTENVLQEHKLQGGFLAAFANFIRYVFALFDFTGFSYSEYLTGTIVGIQHGIFDFFGLPYDLGVLFKPEYEVNNSIMEVYSGLGILGFLVFVPSLFLSIFNVFKEKFSINSKVFLTLTVMFLVNIIILSFSLGYMPFSIRFVSYFAMMSSPLLCLTYIKSNKNIFKWIVMFYVLSYFLVISTHIEARPLFLRMKTLKESKNLSTFRDKLQCSETFYISEPMLECQVREYIKTRPKTYKTAVFSKMIFRGYILKCLEFKGYKIDFLVFEDYDKVDLSKYDLIVVNKSYQLFDYIRKYKERVKNIIKTPAGIQLTQKHSAECFYLDNKSDFLYNGSTNLPAKGVCYVPYKDFNKNGFELVKEFNIDYGPFAKSPDNPIQIFEKKPL